MNGLTRQLGDFIATLQAKQVPDAAFVVVRRGIADYMGVLCAGRDEPVVGHAMASITPTPAGSSLLLDRGHASPADAAFVNATAGHALDYDDTGLDGHPSVVLGPVVLAGAEDFGLSWREAVTAYLAGYEVWAELIGRDADKHHGKGWHPTAVFGTLASAAAAAWMRKLNAQQSAHALGIAASMASGVIANFGSMTKPLQVGWAARNGMLAAMLAGRGVTASPDTIESPRGFLAALSPAGRVRLDGPVNTGASWQILHQGLNIKRYPVCYGAHRAVDAALSLSSAFAQRRDEVVEVLVRIGHLQAAMLRSDRPETSLDAKFSIQYALAAALLRGKLGLAELTHEQVMAPDVQALLRRVRVEKVNEPDPQDHLFSPADQVIIRFANGSELASDPVRRAKGHAENPLSTEELRLKFIDCFQAPPGASAAAKMWHQMIEASLDDAV